MSVKRDSLLSWLMTVLSATLLINILIVACQVTNGKSFKSSLKSTAVFQFLGMRKSVGTDSWEPMLKAHQLKVNDPRSDMYRIFFEEHVKFQYPPTAIVFIKMIPSRLTQMPDGFVSDWFLEWVSWFSQIAVLFTVIISALILGVTFERVYPSPAGDASWAVGYRPLLCFGLGLTYYPLLIGYVFGQVQVFLTALIALALFFKLKGREVLGGACIGLCCLIKPQYGIFFLWALVRKRWHFMLGFGGVFLIGLTASLSIFGLQDHLRYFEVLQTLSRHGESYWPNQSFNGLTNRFLKNGDAIHFSVHDYAPFHPTVRLLTGVSAFALLVIAFWQRRRVASRDSDNMDFAIILLAATMASPIAWEHHYGILLPVFAAALPFLMRYRPWGKATAPLLCVSYALAAQVIECPDKIFSNRWTGLLGSHLFFGALILFALLVTLRAKLRNPMFQKSVEV